MKKRAQDVTAEDIRNACKRLGIDPVYDAGLDYIVDEFLAVQLPRVRAAPAGLASGSLDVY